MLKYEYVPKPARNSLSERRPSASASSASNTACSWCASRARPSCSRTLCISSSVMSPPPSASHSANSSFARATHAASFASETVGHLLEAQGQVLGEGPSDDMRPSSGQTLEGSASASLVRLQQRPAPSVPLAHSSNEEADEASSFEGGRGLST